jgi:hypothetical protein
MFSPSPKQNTKKKTTCKTIETNLAKQISNAAYSHKQMLFFVGFFFYLACPEINKYWFVKLQEQILHIMEIK